VSSARPSAQLIPSTLAVLLGHLAAVKTGSEDAIHEARVSIRHLREGLSVARVDYKEDDVAAIEHALARAARALSRARDADVGQRLIQHVAARFPFAPRVLGRLQTAIAVEQVALRRKAIKKLERLELESLPEQLRHAQRHNVAWLESRRGWRTALGRHTQLRTADVRLSIDRAGAVYFPNRLHSARVAIKQLRYTLELADRLGSWRPPGTVGVLKKAQATLGEAHDRHVLLARLDALRAADTTVNRDEIDALEQFLRAEILARHEKYVQLLPRILAVCDACTPPLRRSYGAGPVVVAAGFVLPSLILLRRLTSSSTTDRRAPAGVRELRRGSKTA
jgi:CHAD domain-containing protein